MRVHLSLKKEGELLWHLLMPVSWLHGGHHSFFAEVYPRVHPGVLTWTSPFCLPCRTSLQISGPRPTCGGLAWRLIARPKKVHL